MELTPQQRQTYENITALKEYATQIEDALHKSTLSNSEELSEAITLLSNRVEEGVERVSLILFQHIQKGESPNEGYSRDIDNAIGGIYDALYALKECGEEVVN
jgi:hypothetical protein